MRLCPDCGVAPAPDQREWAKDGRCKDCRARLGLPRVYDEGGLYV